MNNKIEKFTLIELSDNVDIYRFISLPDLLNLLEFKKLSFTNVMDWEDISEIPIKQFLSKEEILEKRKKCIQYGSCWTKSFETDALWRIYSPDCRSLCLHSTVRDLIIALNKANPEIEGCIAPIIYGDVRNLILDELFGREYSDTYGSYVFSFLKREPFSHEKEIRLIVNKPNLPIPTPKYIELNVDFKDFLKEVIFDPRVENWFCELIGKIIKTNGISYKKYDLYTFQKRGIKIQAKIQTHNAGFNYHYVTYEHNNGIYHLVDFSADEKENDKTFCGQDLHTRKGISIWKNLTNGLSFSDEPPNGKKLCKNCRRKNRNNNC